jgi:hypothetical protein
MSEFRLFRSLCICLAGLLSSAILGPGLGSAAVIIFIKVRQEGLLREGESGLDESGTEACEVKGGNERMSSTESSDGGPVIAARARDLKNEVE